MTRIVMIGKEDVRQKEPPFVSPDLRKFAYGKECQMKGPNCLDDRETTALCHSRTDAEAGMAEKPDDTWAYHGCAACHLWEHEGKASFRALYNAIRRTQKAVMRHFGTLTP